MTTVQSHPSPDTAAAAQVQAFYERYPYPGPIDSLDQYRQLWADPQRRRADHHLFQPGRPYREDPSILIAGCGTSQAARHAVRWPAQAPRPPQVTVRAPRPRRGAGASVSLRATQFGPASFPHSRRIAPVLCTSLVGIDRGGASQDFFSF